MLCERCGEPMVEEPRGDTLILGIVAAVAYQCTSPKCGQIVLYRVGATS